MSKNLLFITAPLTILSFMIAYVQYESLEIKNKLRDTGGLLHKVFFFPITYDPQTRAAWELSRRLLGPLKIVVFYLASAIGYLQFMTENLVLRFYLTTYAILMTINMLILIS